MTLSKHLVCVRTMNSIIYVPSSCHSNRSPGATNYYNYHIFYLSHQPESTHSLLMNILVYFTSGSSSKANFLLFAAGSSAITTRQFMMWHRIEPPRSDLGFFPPRRPVVAGAHAYFLSTLSTHTHHQPTTTNRLYIILCCMLLEAFDRSLKVRKSEKSCRTRTTLISLHRSSIQRFLSIMSGLIQVS